MSDDRQRDLGPDDRGRTSDRVAERGDDAGPVSHHDRGRELGRDADDRPDRPMPSRREVLAHEEEEHCGIKVGSAFFGWLTATGMTVILTAILVAAGTAVGIATGTDANSVTDRASSSSGTVGIVGGLVLLVILLVAYYCGGYVAGRMARFNGLKQGVAVWLWAVLIAIVVAVLGAVAGSRYDVLATLNSFPRIPVSEGNLALGGIIAAVAAVVVALVGALLGGLAGMRFHRKVDKASLGR